MKLRFTSALAVILLVVGLVSTATAQRSSDLVNESMTIQAEIIRSSRR